jgi:hypothetical protein
MAGCSRLSSMLIHPAQTTGCDSVQPFGEPPVDNNFASTLPVRAGIPNLNVWQVVTTAILMSNGNIVGESGPLPELSKFHITSMHEPLTKRG